MRMCDKNTRVTKALWRTKRSRKVCLMAELVRRVACVVAFFRYFAVRRVLKANAPP